MNKMIIVESYFSTKNTSVVIDKGILRLLKSFSVEI